MYFPKPKVSVIDAVKKMPVKIVTSYYTIQVIISIYFGEKNITYSPNLFYFIYLHAPTYADTYI